MTERATAHVLLITGSPGVGKTTIIQKVAAALSGRRLGGFCTEEIRADGERRGFRLVAFDGQEWTMAHVGIRGPHRVGKYGVDVAAVEEAATTVLAAGRADLYLVDEIGRMECLSPGFVAAMRRLLDSPATVVATVALRGDGLIAEVKQRADAEIWTVTVRIATTSPGVWSGGSEGHDMLKVGGEHDHAVVLSHRHGLEQGEQHRGSKARDSRGIPCAPRSPHA